jgi:hypothetical protein
MIPLARTDPELITIPEIRDDCQPKFVSIILFGNRLLALCGDRRLSL